jgi:hypothetical protein
MERYNDDDGIALERFKRYGVFAADVIVRKLAVFAS